MEERRKIYSTWIAAIIFVTLINSVQSTCSSTVKARKYVVKNYFDGLPKRSDYEIVEYQLPPLKDGEILVKAKWISVDHYQRSFNPLLSVPYDQFGYQAGIVEASKDPKYPVGTRVISHKGWCDYSIVNASKVLLDIPIDITWKFPDTGGLSSSKGVGAAGLTGLTAYFGLLEICKPKPGETVVVTGAAGAVGSIVGQIAKIKGCKVIGFAGSEQKIQWLENELGFDKAINYKTADIAKALKEAAPNGVDCYFDTVGGEISSTVISQMNRKGRVAVSGSISSYSGTAKATILQPYFVDNELKMEGFITKSWYSRWPEAIAQLIQWIKSGQIKAREDITVGFDKIFDAFIKMLSGQSIGKAVVKVT